MPTSKLDIIRCHMMILHFFPHCDFSPRKFIMYLFPQKFFAFRTLEVISTPRSEWVHFAIKRFVMVHTLLTDLVNKTWPVSSIYFRKGEGKSTRIALKHISQNRPTYPIQNTIFSKITPYARSLIEVQIELTKCLNYYIIM